MSARDIIEAAEVYEKMDSPEFQRWFGQSKVVDAAGRPRRVYHGTVVWKDETGRGLGDFDQFDRRAAQKVFNRPSSMDHVGSWFSSTSEGAEGYGGAIYPVYLRIENPVTLTWQQFLAQGQQAGGWKPRHKVPGTKLTALTPQGRWDAEKLRSQLKGQGYDGIYFPASERIDGQHHEVWVALEPEQIKSALANRGTWNPESPKIDEAIAPADYEQMQKEARRLTTLGWVEQGVVRVRPPYDQDGETHYHHPERAENYERFRYFEPTGKVVWTEDASLEAQHAVENWLRRKGMSFAGHSSNFGTVAQRVIEQEMADVAGEKIDKEWTAFAEDSGTLGIPRDEMPQIKAEHRGALAQFLKARDIDSQDEEVLPSDLKPTQQEYSPGKVKKAREFTGGDRAILVSADDFVVDGHHQWLAKLQDIPGEKMRVIRFDAPIREVLKTMAEFPSVEASEGAKPVKENVGQPSWWISPDGRLEEVEADHSGWAQEYLNQPIPEEGEEDEAREIAVQEMFSAGWRRVVQEGDIIYVNGDLGNDALTRPQRETLEYLAAERHCSLWHGDEVLWEPPVHEALKIRVPPFAQGAFFQDHGAPEEFWAMRSRPPTRAGEMIEFYFGSAGPVATARVSRVEPPGQSACGHSGKFQDKWKVHWLDKTFRKLSEENEWRFISLVLDAESAAKVAELAHFENVHAHHVTMAYAPTEEQLAWFQPLIGQVLSCRAVALSADDKAQALRVEGVPSLNRDPHITVSCAEGVRPVYSNELLAREPGEPLDLELKGTVTEETLEK